jgi:RND family efflux transporter MFP subunit
MNKRMHLAWGLSGLLLAAPAFADVDARIEWGRRIELGIPVSGVVGTINAEPGAQVSKGALLLQLEQTPFAAAVQQARAAVTRAENDHHVAKRDLAQAQELYDRGLLSNNELEDAKLKLGSAKATLDAARATLTTAQYALARSTIRAPFDGWILDRRVEVGQSIVSTDQAPVALVVAAANEYVARALVDSDHVEKLKPGMPARIMAGGRQFDGVVRAVGLEPVAGADGTPRYAVSVAFDSKGARLFAGQKGEIGF